MSKDTSTTIRLLNKSYTLKCPSMEADNLGLAADKLNQHLLDKKKQFRHLDEYNLLLLAALQVSHELILERNQHEKKNQHLSQLIAVLESHIRQPTETQHS
jgi:cell division protein ZapA